MTTQPPSRRVFARPYWLLAALLLCALPVLAPSPAQAARRHHRVQLAPVPAGMIAVPGTTLQIARAQGWAAVRYQATLTVTFAEGKYYEPALYYADKGHWVRVASHVVEEAPGTIALKAGPALLRPGTYAVLAYHSPHVGMSPPIHVGP